MLVQIDTSEYSKVYEGKRTNLMKRIECLRDTMPPRYKFKQRANEMEHLAYLIGIKEGLDTALVILHNSIDGE